MRSISAQTLSGLTDAEFAWEPVDGSWRVFRDNEGRVDHTYAIPDPKPPPFTTIGWRLVHIALCKVMYHEWAFGHRDLTWSSIETPGDVEATIGTLERGHGLLADDLASLRDDALERRVLTNWGEHWPTWRIFTTMIDHDRHHGAEIGVLRATYTGSPAPSGYERPLGLKSGLPSPGRRRMMERDEPSPRSGNMTRRQALLPLTLVFSIAR